MISRYLVYYIFQFLKWSSHCSCIPRPELPGQGVSIVSKVRTKSGFYQLVKENWKRKNYHVTPNIDQTEENHFAQVTQGQEISYHWENEYVVRLCWLICNRADASCSVLKFLQQKVLPVGFNCNVLSYIGRSFMQVQFGFEDFHLDRRLRIFCANASHDCDIVLEGLLCLK